MLNLRRHGRTLLGMRGMLALCLFVAAGYMGGCQQALFIDDAARTPYDRYLTLRGQARPATETDGLGVERPALRQRLRPLGK